MFALKHLPNSGFASQLQCIHRRKSQEWWIGDSYRISLLSANSNENYWEYTATLTDHVFDNEKPFSFKP